MENSTNLNSNRNIDAFIFGSNEMAIDDTSARQYLADYLNDLEALRSGVQFSELGISKRRAESMPCLIYDNSGETLTADFTQENIAARPGQLAHLKLTGAMRMNDGLSSRGVSSLIDDIRTANASPNISGVLLEVNSGGGEASAGNALYTAMQDSQKPVVALIHRAGSAALMGILPAAKRVSNGQLSETGSIGVYSTIDKKFVEWYSENYQDIYADQSPDKNNEHRDLLKGSIGSIQRSVNKTADVFQKIVSSNLTLNENLKDSTLAGGMFMAADAKKRGLVDEIGSFQSAIKTLQSEVRKAARPSNKNTKDMGFFSQLLGGDNKPADKPADVQAAAMNDQPSLEDLGDTIKNLADRLTANETATANFAQMQADLQKATAQIATLENELFELAATAETAATANAELSAQVETLTTQLADVEGRIVDNEGKPIVRRGNRAVELSESEKTFKQSFKAIRKKEEEAKAA